MPTRSGRKYKEEAPSANRQGGVSIPHDRQTKVASVRRGQTKVASANRQGGMGGRQSPYIPKNSKTAKRDSARFYSRHFFEYLRKQTEARIRKGFRVRFTTLRKYDLVEYYKEYANEEYLAMMKNEMLFEDRRLDEENPYVNETARRVANAIKANQVGKAFTPANIKLVINAPGTTQSFDEGVLNKHPSLEEDFDTTLVGDFPEPPPAKDKKGQEIYTFEDAVYDIQHGEWKGQPLKPRTIQGNISNLKTIMRTFNCNPKHNMLDCVKKSERTIGILRKKFSYQGKNLIGTIIALARYSPKFKTLLGDLHYERWKKNFDEVMDIYRKGKKKRAQETKIIRWEELVKVRETLKKEWEASFLEKSLAKRGQGGRNFPPSNNKKNLEYLLWSLYTLQPPRRDDYWNVKVVGDVPIANDGNLHKEDGKLLNYYGRKNKVLVLQNYKNNRLYKQQRYVLKTLKSPLGDGKKLIAVIESSLKAYPRDWLFVKMKGKQAGKPYGRLDKDSGTDTNVKSGLTTMIGKIAKRFPSLKEKNYGRRIGINTFRHSFVSHTYLAVQITDEQKEELARNMLHSTKTASEVYLNQYLEDTDFVKGS